MRKPQESDKEKHFDKQKAFLKKELEIFMEKDLDCFYFGNSAKVNIKEENCVFSYGTGSGWPDWTATLSQVLTDMNSLREGFAANNYECSEYIPRSSKDEMITIFAGHHESYQRGEPSTIWNREKGVYGKQKEEQKVKKSASNPISDTNRLIESDWIILVNVETYLTIALHF